MTRLNSLVHLASLLKTSLGPSLRGFTLASGLRMVLNVEEHTITSRSWLWSNRRLESLESFAEYGSWHQDRVTWGLTRLIATAGANLARLPCLGCR